MSRSNDIANITSSVLDGVTKAEVGLGNVDNTSDANKPVSTAQQSAIDLKANIASPTFTGNVALGSNASGTFNGTIGTSASHANIDLQITKIDNGEFPENTASGTKHNLCTMQNGGHYYLSFVYQRDYVSTSIKGYGLFSIAYTNTGGSGLNFQSFKIKSNNNADIRMDVVNNSGSLAFEWVADTANYGARYSYVLIASHTIS